MEQLVLISSLYLPRNIDANILWARQTDISTPNESSFLGEQILCQWVVDSTKAKKRKFTRKREFSR
jgi:hypothetical protein